MKLKRRKKRAYKRKSKIPLAKLRKEADILDDCIKNYVDEIGPNWRKQPLLGMSKYRDKLTQKILHHPDTEK